MPELIWEVQPTSVRDIELYVARRNGFCYSISIFEGIIKAFLDIEGINLPSLSRRTFSIEEAKNVCQQWADSFDVLICK